MMSAPLGGCSARVCPLRYLVLISLVLVSVSITHAEELIIYTEELPPLNYYDRDTESAAGYSVEIVKELLKRSGFTVSGGYIRVFPWVRAFQKAQETKNALLFSMTRTPDREALFKWVGPIADRTVWMWKLKARNDIDAPTLEKAKDYTVAGVSGFAATEYLKQQGFEVELTTSVEQNWKKLLAGRVDLGTALELEAACYMKQMGRRFHQLERLFILDDSHQFYIALNRQTEDDIVERLQLALDRMKSDGCLKRLHDQFLD